MRLQTRIVLLVFLIVALATVSLTSLGRFYLYPKFVELEDEQAVRNMNIGLELLNNEVTSIADRPPDWGYWDDTYNYMQDRNKEYDTSNLNVSTQYSLKVNLFALYDREGNRIWSRAIRLDTLQPLTLDEYQDDKLPQTHPLLSHEDMPRTRAGLMNSAHGPLLLASTPILYSNRTGPSRGTLIFGRLFDPEKILRIATQAGLALKLSPHNTMINDAQSVSTKIDDIRLQHTELKIERSNGTIFVKTILFSIDGKPSTDLTISMPTAISERGLRTLNTITVTILILGLLLSLILTSVLNRFVTKPIGQITEHIAKIGSQENFSARIKLSRKDEIGALANAFDQMLQRLDDTRKRLFKQSYQTGASEMARGVIKDFSKAIQPLRENVVLPMSLLDRAHTSTSADLIHALSDTKIDSHHFVEITQRLRDLNNEQALILAEARSEMRRMRIDVERLQDVVSDYSKFIAQNPDVEPVLVPNLIEYALKKLDSSERDILKIEIDPAVYHAAPVAASQNLLQQVINVVIRHFVETSKTVALPPLLLRVSCRTEMSHGVAQQHICFDDNSPIMSPAEFQNYLTQTWTVKNADVGLNLAWAESAITSMAGKLSIEQSSLLEGIAIHLVLPRAKFNEN